MDKILDHFDPKKWLEILKEDPKQLGSVLVIIFGLLFLQYRFVYLPKNKNIQRLQRTLSSNARELQHIKDSVDSKYDMQIELAESTVEAKNALEKCYKKSEATDFFRRIPALASLAGIKLRGINPQPSKPIKLGTLDAEQLSTAIKFSGTFKELILFLRLIELEKKTTFLILPSLTTTSNNNYELELYPTTIIIPDALVNSVLSEDNEDE